MNMIAETVAFLVGLVLMIAIPVAGIVWAMSMIAFPTQLAQIEQLRSDAAFVDPAQAEDVIGQVTKWNQTIVSNQTFNDMWFISIFVPDEWDAVEVIPVPVER